MRKKNSDIKVKLLIRETETNKILACQRVATFNQSLEGDEWGVDADSTFIESKEAYESLITSFNEGRPVNVQLEFLSDKKHVCSCTITRFKSNIPYADLEQYSLSLKSDELLTLYESSNVLS